MESSAQTMVSLLPSHLMKRDDSARSGADYLNVVRTAIDNHPRSLQKQIGPSEIGDVCERKIAYKLLGTVERERPSAWKPTIGTAVHSWLEDAFDADNLAHLSDMDGEERWMVETKVTSGFVPGVGFITGSCDLYDRVCAHVWDHKIVGRTQLKKYRSQGPSDVYRVQAHLYGQGWVNRGFPVDWVGICFLPRDGDLSDTFQWAEEFDSSVAENALARLGKIAAVVAESGEGAPAALTPGDSYCYFCPFFSPKSTDLSVGCPGFDLPEDSQLRGLVN